MKGHYWYIGFAILSSAIGCNQAEQSAEKAAADAAAAMQQAQTQAMEAVEKAGKEATAVVKDASVDAKAALASAAAEIGNLKVGDVELGKELSTLVDRAKGALGDVKDAASAKAAVPKLDEVNIGLDKLVALLDQLPAAAKPALAAFIKSHTGTINESAQKVAGIPGVGEILKPVLDQIVAKLNKFGGGEAVPTP
jgi:enamine deaminase RidA (YjgF/YER057c/UK114 family)